MYHAPQANFGPRWGKTEHVFLGEYTHAIDDKGRLTLPAKWREDLAGGVVITRGLDPCLFIFPMARFQAIADEMDHLGLNKADARKLSRFLAAKAMDDRPDKQGRIIVPPSLREYAGLDGDALIVGANNRIEVWTPERYAEANQELEQNVQDVSERMGDVLQRALYKE